MNNKEQTMEERFAERFELESHGCSECGGFELIDKKEVRYPHGEYHCEYDFDKVLDFIKQELQQERERSTRKTIKDIAPNGVTGGMIAITKKSVNGKNTFPVVSVHFEHDLIALDDFDDENNPTWYRAEDIIKAINQD